jgi:hypothetical protein
VDRYSFAPRADSRAQEAPSGGREGKVPTRNGFKI